MKARIFWLLVILGLGGAVAYRVKQVKEQNAKPEERKVDEALVRAGRVARRDLTLHVSLTGSVRPKNEVDVFPKVGGRLEQLSIQVGDKVKVGQGLGGIEHKEIAWQAKAAEAAVAVAKANLDGAKLELDRTEALHKGGSAPQSQLDGAKVRYALAEAQLAQAEASAGLAKQQVDNAHIEAPIKGTVTRRPVNLGAQVGPQTTFCTLQDVDTLKLEAAVDAATFARLQKGTTAEVSIDTLPNETFPGVVTLLSPSLDPVSRRASVELEIDNASGKLLPNMFARAELQVGTLTGALVVPKAALLEAPGGVVAYRLRDGKAEVVHPKLGAEDSGYVQVLSGLSEGDTVATSGIANLADGARVKVAPAPGA